MKCTVVRLLCLAILAAGCASVSVNSDWDSAADFSNLKTYSWLSTEQPRTGDPRLDNSLLDTRIREAVDRVLFERGYQRLEGGGVPDFWVSYHAAVQGKLDATTIPSSYYTAPVIRADGTIDQGWNSWGVGPQSMITQYEEGTILVDFANPATKRLIWRGSASGVVEPSLSREKRTKRINGAIEKILAKFPPK